MKTKFFYNFRVFKHGVLIQYGRRSVERDWLIVNTYHGKTNPQHAFKQLLESWNYNGKRPNILGLTYEYEPTEESGEFYTNTPENEMVKNMVGA